MDDAQHSQLPAGDGQGWKFPHYTNGIQTAMQESCAFLIWISLITVRPTKLKNIKKQVCVCVCVFQIRDGGSEYSPILGKRYCGSELPPLVTSTQNLLWLKFHTDDITDVQSVGFSARYTSGPPGVLPISFIKVINNTVFINSLERISDTYYLSKWDFRPVHVCFSLLWQSKSSDRVHFCHLWQGGNKWFTSVLLWTLSLF